jgi:hypothetical protein
LRVPKGQLKAEKSFHCWKKLSELQGPSEKGLKNNSIKDRQESGFKQRNCLLENCSGFSNLPIENFSRGDLLEQIMALNFSPSEISSSFFFRIKILIDWILF